MLLVRCTCLSCWMAHAAVQLVMPCACSEVVPEQLRSTVYAFDRSFEGAVGATAAPLVGAHLLPVHYLPHMLPYS